MTTYARHTMIISRDEGYDSESGADRPLAPAPSGLPSGDSSTAAFPDGAGARATSRLPADGRADARTHEEREHPGRFLRLTWRAQHRLDDGTVAGIEALLRRDRAGLEDTQGRKFISPGARSKLMARVELWALEEAARQAKPWLNTGSACPPRISLRVSALAGHVVHCVDELLSAVRRQGVRPDQLELSIAASMFSSRVPATETLLRALGALGFHLAVDDFGPGAPGSGWPGLVYLERLPVHRLNLDRGVVADLAASRATREAVAATIAAAHSLGMRVVAKEVETDTQRAVLRELGCDAAQGPLFGRPTDLQSLRRRWRATRKE